MNSIHFTITIPAFCRSTRLLCSITAVMLLTFSCSDHNRKMAEINSGSDTTKVATTKPAEASLPKPANPPSNFQHRTTNVNGINIHYVMGGSGEPLLLLHGFGQNWFMWNRLLPELSKHFTVIAPDLPGVGESDKPETGYDKKTVAVHIHDLVNKLGFQKINLAGHDIGLMVAYAYAVQYQSEVKKLALMDALVPGIEPVWSNVRSFAWWFGFFDWPASGELVKGREKLFLTNFWPQVGHIQNAFTKEETDEFIRAYSVNGATTSSFNWFGAFSQDAKDNLVYAKHKLTIPVLAMGGEFAGNYMPEHIKLVAQNVKGVIIKNSGHWVVQENTEQTGAALLNFFAP